MHGYVLEAVFLEQQLQPVRRPTSEVIVVRLAVHLDKEGRGDEENSPFRYHGTDIASGGVWIGQVFENLFGNHDVKSSRKSVPADVHLRILGRSI